MGLPGGGFAMLWRGSFVGGSLNGSRALLNSIKYMIHQATNVLFLHRTETCWILICHGAVYKWCNGAPDWPACAGGKLQQVAGHRVSLMQVSGNIEAPTISPQVYCPLF